MVEAWEQSRIQTEREDATKSPPENKRESKKKQKRTKPCPPTAKNERKAQQDGPMTSHAGGPRGMKRGEGSPKHQDVGERTNQ